TTVVPLQQVAEGNRAARVGDVEKARSLYATAIRNDPSLRDFISPPEQGAQLAARGAALSKSWRRRGLIAQGDRLIGLAVAAKADGDPGEDSIKAAAVGDFGQGGWAPEAGRG